MGLLNLCQNAICHVPVKTSNNGRWKLPIHMALALLKRNLDKLHGAANARICQLNKKILYKIQRYT